MSAEICVGIRPAVGDEALITRLSAPNATGARWLHVEAITPYPDPAWARLAGRWLDATPGQPGAGTVMVWLDHLIIRKPSL